MKNKVKIVSVDINGLKPNPRNVKLHSEQQIEKLMKSIKKYGQIQNLVIDKDGTIVIGHARREAMKKLGFKEILVCKAEGFSQKELDALMIIDNKLNESPYNIVNLQDILRDLDGDFDLQDFGFSVQELDMMDIAVDLGNDIGGIPGADSISNIGNNASLDPNVSEMTNLIKQTPSEIKGGSNQKESLIFFCSKDQYKILLPIFETSRKYEQNVEKLLEITNFYNEKNK